MLLDRALSNYPCLPVKDPPLPLSLHGCHPDQEFEIPDAEAPVDKGDDMDMPDVGMVVMHGGHKPDGAPEPPLERADCRDGQSPHVQIPLGILPVRIGTEDNANKLRPGPRLVNEPVGLRFVEASPLVKQFPLSVRTLHIRPVGNVADAGLDACPISRPGLVCSPGLGNFDNGNRLILPLISLIQFGVLLISVFECRKQARDSRGGFAKEIFCPFLTFQNDLIQNISLNP